MDDNNELDDAYFDDPDPDNQGYKEQPTEAPAGMFKLSDVMKVSDDRPIRKRINKNHILTPAEKKRGHEAVMRLLTEYGALRAIDINNTLILTKKQSINQFLNTMVIGDQIKKTGQYYHLPKQSAVPLGPVPPKSTDLPAWYLEESVYPTSEAHHDKTALAEAVDDIKREPYHNFFVGDTFVHKTRRFIRDHQNEPLTYIRISAKVGYSNRSGAEPAIKRMLGQNILRRYKDPSDFGFEWRYEYIPEELSGIKVTKLVVTEPEKAEAVLAHVPEPLDVSEPALMPEPAPEPEKAEAEVTATEAADIIEKYSKEFFWATGGSRDIRELVIWMKERKLAGEENGLPSD